MATTPKTGGRRGRPPAKPATIDLEAKDVSKADTSADAAKDKPATKSQSFGRDAARGTTTSTKPSAAKPDTKAKPTDTAKKAEENETEAKKPDTPAPKAKSGSSFTSGLAGACLAVLGLGAIGQINGASDLPLIGSLYNAPVSQQTPSSDNSDELASINQRLDALSADFEKSGNSPNNTSSAELTAIADRLTQLENAEPTAVPQVDDSRISSLEAGLTELSSALEAVSANTGEGSSDTVALDALKGQITALEGEISAISTPDLQPIETAIATLEQQISALQSQIEQNASAIAAATQAAKTLSTDIEAVRINREVAGAVAVSALEAALETGAPLSVPIASLEALNGRTDDTARLGELAKSGIPTFDSLGKQLSQIMNSVQNPDPVAQDASITDKIWANARSLVTVRSSGPREGNSTPAILSRVKAQLDETNLQGAKSEWDQLPGDIKSTHENWLEDLEKRLEATQLVQKISDNLSGTSG